MVGTVNLCRVTVNVQVEDIQTLSKCHRHKRAPTPRPTHLADLPGRVGGTAPEK